MSISIHGPTNNGGYNVLGLKDQLFILQGNLTLAEIKELRDQCDATLKDHYTCTCLTDQAGDGCNCQRKHPDSPVPCPACDCPVHGGDES